MQNKILRLDSKDNVLIALADLNQGEHVGWEGTSCILGLQHPRQT